VYYIKKVKENQMKFLLLFQIYPSLESLDNMAYLPVCGKPLSLLQFERMQRAKLVGDYAITISSGTPEKKLPEIFEGYNIHIAKNFEISNLTRNTKLAVEKKADAVILITNESPLLDPEIIDTAIEFYIANFGNFDYISNMHPESYPQGNSVEIIDTFALIDAMRLAKYDYEKRYTTPYIWDNPDKWRIGNFSAEQNYSKKYRYSLNYKKDFEVVKNIYEHFSAKTLDFSYKDIISYLNQTPEIYALNDEYKGSNWYNKYFRQLKTISSSDTRLID
jgi:spore coat polysaccharide biosynthesis protein SpsF